MDSIASSILNSETETFSNHPFRKIEIQKWNGNVKKGRFKQFIIHARLAKADP
jgi:hypothetical protein